METTLEEIKAAVADSNGSVHVVRIFSLMNDQQLPPFGLQVFLKTRKIGPMLVPKTSQTIDDMLEMLYS